MSGLLDALVVTAVIGLVITRQFRPSRIDTGRRWWVLPLVLGIVALREPGMIDAHHRTAAVLLLAAEMIVGLATGAGWAWTTRIWAEADGAVWSRGTRASVAVWVAGIALRVGLYGVGAVLGVRQDGVLSGDAGLAPSIQRRLLERLSESEPRHAGPPEPPDGLTARETEVLVLIADGLTNQQIASRLQVSTATVKTHINNLFAKTGIKDRAQAVRYAYGKGLVRPPGG
ncbi:HTH-type transcriptional regulator MalT [Streptomyces tendae]